MDPVVQSIVSLTISLRLKFVKQISAKVTNTLLFFVALQRILTFFQQKNNSVIVILMFEILMKRFKLTASLVLNNWAVAYYVDNNVLCPASESLLISH